MQLRLDPETVQSLLNLQTSQLAAKDAELAVLQAQVAVAEVSRTAPCHAVKAHRPQAESAAKGDEISRLQSIIDGMQVSEGVTDGNASILIGCRVLGDSHRRNKEANDFR